MDLAQSRGKVLNAGLDETPSAVPVCPRGGGFSRIDNGNEVSLAPQPHRNLKLVSPLGANEQDTA
jgi:hypothetical protein